ncbi:hypothetical protein [Streptomyces litchfieldiae]|uniref:Uncharacterized protein n=1 Tax=Streptomyces litchfieldiae TaxID=3075543 RepID=A0ABU2N473_9ACTN|nr:hypothetical protein [Streptomyces sp. DSM 44938]MDT0347529.1 hypothetical protein [Streptomyces sp. DSM 44938]
MARLKLTITPVHADGTACTHKMRPSGKPADPTSGCTGRARYRVTCSGCTWTEEPGLRVLAEDARDSHRRLHMLGRPTPLGHGR